MRDQVKYMDSIHRSEKQVRIAGCRTLVVARGPLILAVAVLHVFLGGCSEAAIRASIVRKVTSPRDEAAARKYVDLLRQNRFDQIEEACDSSMKPAGLRTMLGQMAAIIPRESPRSVKVVGLVRELRSSTNVITLEYEFPRQWVLAELALRTAKDGADTIAGFRISTIPESLEHQNRFTFAGKGAPQYAILLLAAMSAAISIYALVVCLRARTGKKKWLWALATLVGVCSYGVNWTTGESGFVLLAVHVPTFGLFALSYGAWTVFANLPLGALLFLANERARQNAESGVSETRPESGTTGPRTI